MQFVKMNSDRSRCVSFKFGVPQSSDLGPMLFIFMGNDIATAFKCHERLLSTVDLKIFYTTCEGCFVYKLNCLHLNLNNCFVIYYHRELKPII